MKRRICMLAASAIMVMALGTFAHAQEGGGGQRRPQMTPEERVNRLNEQLTLTDDQKTKITAIYKDSSEQMGKLREDQSLSQDDRRAKMMDINKASNDKVRAVLNADQQKKFDDMQAQMRQRGPGGPGGQGSGQGGQKPPDAAPKPPSL